MGHLQLDQATTRTREEFSSKEGVYLPALKYLLTRFILPTGSIVHCVWYTPESSRLVTRLRLSIQQREQLPEHVVRFVARPRSERVVGSRHTHDVPPALVKLLGAC